MRGNATRRTLAARLSSVVRRGTVGVLPCVGVVGDGAVGLGGVVGRVRGASTHAALDEPRMARRKRSTLHASCSNLARVS